MDDPLYVSRQCVVLSAFAGVLSRRPDALSAVLDKLFALSQFTPSRGADLKSIKADTMASRRRACYSLISLAKNKSISQLLVKHLDAIASKVEALLSNCRQNTSMFLEMLVRINNESTDASQSLKFLNSILTSQLADLSKPPLSTFIMSPEQLATSLGCTSATTFDASVYRQHDLDLSRLCGALNSCNAVLRSVKVSQQTQPELYGLVCTAAATSLKHCLSLIENVHRLYGSFSSHPVLDSFSTDTTDEVFTSSRGRVTALADVGYAMFALAMRFPPCLQSIDAAAILRAVVEPLKNSSVHSTVFHFLIGKALVPFVDLTSIQDRVRLVVPVLQQFAEVMQTILAQRWNNLNSRSADNQTGEAVAREVKLSVTVACCDNECVDEVALLTRYLRTILFER